MKLSIITVNYNNVDGLCKTIKSVLSQKYDDFEWIVIDGGSTDGSRDIIEKYKDKFAYWCSEPDNGVYHAMNKGVKHAKGTYLNFMNSGDIYYSDSVLTKVFSEERNEDILYGDVRFIYNDKYMLEKSPSELTLFYLYQCNINHQASFIRCSLLQESGYDEKLSIVSDWKKWVEWMLQNKTFFHLEQIIVDMDTSGISFTNTRILESEREIVKKECFPFGIIRDLSSLEQIQKILIYNPEIDELYSILNSRRLNKRIIQFFLMLTGLISKLCLKPVKFDKPLLTEFYKPIKRITYNKD